MIQSLGSSVPGLSEAEIEKKAYTFRDLIFLSQAGPCPMIKIVEKTLPRLMPDFDFLVIDDSEMGNDHARMYPDQLKMHISRTIYDKAWENDGFSNFTLAHELGHLVLHRNIPPSFSRAKAAPKYDCYFNSEWQADKFATYLLMPTIDARATCQTAEDIQQRYHVTIEAARVRHRELFGESPAVMEKTKGKAPRNTSTAGRQMVLDFLQKD